MLGYMSEVMIEGRMRDEYGGKRKLMHDKYEALG